MHYMFASFGLVAAEELKLGAFDTQNVVDMHYMFQNCGRTKMKTFDLGTKFNTINVTSMDSMFYRVGDSLMTSLNLGDQFDTIIEHTIHIGYFACIEFVS